MSTSITEIEAFQQFLSQECSNRPIPPSLDSAVQKFRQIQKLRAKLAESRAASGRGETGLLDVDAMMDRVNGRISAEGTTE